MTVSPPSSGGTRALLDEARRHAGLMVRIRRELHSNPELGFEEHRTAALVIDQLQELGLEPRPNVGGTGVLADLGSAEDGPTVLLRADMDALPIEERSSAPYASRTGSMHACGHDGHVAMLLGAAHLLSAHKSLLPGRVRLLFQPAEERPPGGALAVIDDGALDGVDMALGLHLWNPLPVGSVGVTPGVVMAAHDRLRIRLAGKGGHGAMPEGTHDPLVALAALVAALQTVVSRSISPLESGVLTIGVAQSGSAFNVIPDSAVLEGSIRSLGEAVRMVIHDRIRTLAAGIAAAFSVTVEVEIEPFVPALVNDERLSQIATQVVAEFVAPEALLGDFRTMAGEDMAFIHARVPGCFVFIGSGFTDGRPVFPHHHPSFDIDEDALPMGAATLAGAAMAMLAAPVNVDRKQM